MIVVEGPDGAGKTRLIADLMSEFPLTLAPRVVDKNTNAMVDLVAWVEDNVRKLNQGVIFDRHRLISEMIYGPIMRPHDAQPEFDNLAWMSAMLELFYKQRPTIIYCLPPKDVVIGNVDFDPDNMAVAHRIGLIYDAYVHRAALDFSVPKRAHHYDYTEGRDHRRYIAGVISREEMF